MVSLSIMPSSEAYNLGCNASLANPGLNGRDCVNKFLLGALGVSGARSAGQ